MADFQIIFSRSSRCNTGYPRKKSPPLCCGTLDPSYKAFHSYAFQKALPFSTWEAATGIRKCILTTTWSEKGGDIEIAVSNTGGPKEPQPMVRMDEIRAIRSSDLGDEIVMPISTGSTQGNGGQRRVVVRPARAEQELSDGSYLWTAKVWIRRERGDGDE